ncbi:hypothetical protein [Streptomyces sp. NPDC085529]
MPGQAAGGTRYFRERAQNFPGRITAAAGQPTSDRAPVPEER